MLLLETTFTVDGVLHIGELLALLASGVGFFFNMSNKISVLKTKLESQKEDLTKLENKVDVNNIKMEQTLGELRDKLESLPSKIIDLIKNLKF